MAVYRQLHTSFWQDPFVMTLTPEEKYFFIYLLTNSKTKQCGIYELPIRVAEFETGYNRETVEKLINKFAKNYERIRYDWNTSEVAIRNWSKYNPATNPKIKVCVEKELKQVKNTLLIAYVYPMHSLSQKEKEKEKEEEKEQEVHSKPKTKFSAPPIQDVQNLFSEKGLPEEAERFFNYYEANGWKVGRNPMKNWKAAAANWIKNTERYATNQKSTARIAKSDYKAAADQYDFSAFGNTPVGEIFGIGGAR